MITEWSASRHGCFNPAVAATSNQWIAGDWVGPRALISLLEETEIVLPLTGIKAWVVQPVA